MDTVAKRTCRIFIEADRVKFNHHMYPHSRQSVKSMRNKWCIYHILHYVDINRTSYFTTIYSLVPQIYFNYHQFAIGGATWMCY